MPRRCEEESHTGHTDGIHHRLQRCLEVEPETFEHIGGTDLAAGAAVAVLGHADATGRCREGHRSRNVKGIGPITTGAARIHHQEVGPGAGQRAGLPQDSGHRRQLVGHHALGAQTRQKGSGLHGGELLGQPGPHQLCGLRRRQRLALQQLLQQRRPGRNVSGHRDKATELTIPRSCWS